MDMNEVLTREQMADDAAALQLLLRARAIVREGSGAQSDALVVAVFDRLGALADRRVWERQTALDVAASLQ